MQKRKKQKRTAKLTVLESSATSVSNLLRLARGRSEDRNRIAKNRFLGPTRTSKRSILYQRKASLIPVYQELVCNLHNPFTVYRNIITTAAPGIRMAIGYCGQCLDPHWTI